MNTNIIAIVTVFLEDDRIVKFVHKVSLFGSNVAILAYKKTSPTHPFGDVYKIILELTETN
jgi:hypothetical protein